MTSKFVGAVAFAILLQFGQAHAALVSFDFSGVNTATLGPSPTGYTTISTPFSGTITYDTSSSGTPDGSFPYITNYFSALKSFSVDLGGSSYTGTSGEISVSYNFPGGGDAIFFQIFNPSGPMAAGLPATIFTFGLWDYSGTVFSSMSLPTSFQLSQFKDSANGQNGGGGGNTFYFTNDFQEYGRLSVAVASAAPEASTWAMMILGFCGLGFLTYRRRSHSAPTAA